MAPGCAKPIGITELQFFLWVTHNSACKRDAVELQTIRYSLLIDDRNERVRRGSGLDRDVVNLLRNGESESVVCAVGWVRRRSAGGRVAVRSEAPNGNLNFGDRYLPRVIRRRAPGVEVLFST
jgi:hypothetical protein